MTTAVVQPDIQMTWPDHAQLPDSNGSIVQNFQEHPQSMLLTDTIRPVLQRRHPNDEYAIGQDCGIYWNVRLSLSDRPERGAIAPDWFYVPNVPPLLDGQVRRSYVMWQELIAPLIVIELGSGNGAEEHDRTPWRGKFWIYEQVIRPAFYAIYELSKASVEVYALAPGAYELLSANERGHYPIAPLGVELGIWPGAYQNMTLPWLRWWGEDGNLLLTSDERAQHAEERAERLAAQLRALGVDPEG